MLSKCKNILLLFVSAVFLTNSILLTSLGVSLFNIGLFADNNTLLGLGVIVITIVYVKLCYSWYHSNDVWYQPNDDLKEE